MKRNQNTVRAAHLASRTNPASGKSRYARKVASGRQMYGPGCCAHELSDQQVNAAKRAAARMRDTERDTYQLANYLRTGVL